MRPWGIRFQCEANFSGAVITFTSSSAAIKLQAERYPLYPLLMSCSEFMLEID